MVLVASMEKLHALVTMSGTMSYAVNYCMFDHKSMNLYCYTNEVLFFHPLSDH